MCLEALFKVILPDLSEGIMMNAKLIGSNGCADDTVIIANSLDDLTSLRNTPKMVKWEFVDVFAEYS